MARLLHFTLHQNGPAWLFTDLDDRVFTPPFPTEAAARAYLPHLERHGFHLQEHRWTPPSRPQPASRQQPLL